MRYRCIAFFWWLPALVGLVLWPGGCVRAVLSPAERRIVLDAARREATARGVEVTPSSASITWEGDEWSVLFAPQEGEDEGVSSSEDLHVSLPEYFLVLVSRDGKARRIGATDCMKAARIAKRIAVLRGHARPRAVSAAFQDGSWIVAVDHSEAHGASEAFPEPRRPRRPQLTVHLCAGGTVYVFGSR
jgi:hypothetical protein